MSEATAEPIRRDALKRLGRTALQAVILSALVGAATAVYQLTQDGSVLTLETVTIAAWSGASMAILAWAHRRIEAHMERKSLDV